MEKKTIGSFLTALRKASGMTQRQLAEKLNVSDKAVSRWERDECAPDLSLIPVLAEIYGVTSDEILRGQRTNPDALPREIDAAKAEKQRKRLLASAQTKFRTCSLISAVIALIGLIAACACNYELHKANLGFMAGIIFYMAAAICQITCLRTAFTSISDDEWTASAVTNCKSSLIYWTEGILSGTVILLSLTLPMAGAPGELSFLKCLTTGLQYALIAAVLCFVCCLLVNLIWARRLNTAQNRLRLCCTGAVSFLLIGLLIGHTVLNTYLIDNPQLYAPCDRFETLSSFKNHMEQEIDPNGYRAVWISKEELPTHANKSETVYIYENVITGDTFVLKEGEIVKSLLQAEATASETAGTNRFTAEYGYEFTHMNRYVVHYEISDTDDLVPIYVFNAEQYSQANQIAVQTSLRYALLYLTPILLGTAVYLPLRKKYA